MSAVVATRVVLKACIWQKHRRNPAMEVQRPNGTNGEDITVKKSDSLVYVSVPKTDTQTRNIFTLYSWATSDSKIRAISVDAWPAIESILCDGGYHISHILD